jgi:hypothetical protein
LEQGALVHAITHKEVRVNGGWVQLGPGGWTARLGCNGQQPRCACPLRLCSRAICGGHASDQCCRSQLQLATPYLLCGICGRRYVRQKLTCGWACAALTAVCADQDA